MSESDNLSSSSSSSSLRNDSDILDLGASSWNRQKQSRPLQGRTLFQQLSSLSLNDHNGDIASTTEKVVKHPIHLLQKQIYHTAKHQQQSIDASAITSQDMPAPREQKSELESAVLLDCLTTNFLFSEYSVEELQALMDRFEKVKFRKNEIIMRKGTPAEYFYILYRGDVRKIEEDETTTNFGDGSKYIVLGELELLTHTTNKSTIKATSQPCIFFRLSVNDFFQCRQQHQEHSLSSNDECHRLLSDALPEELKSYFEGDPIPMKRLVSNMRRRTFQKGDVLVHKHNRLDALVIIADGRVVATNVTAGGRTYEDLVIGPGHSRTSFGWQSVMTISESQCPSSTNEESSFPHENALSMMGTIVAQTDGHAFVISKNAFENSFLHHGSTTDVLIDVKHLADIRWKREQLQQIPLFKDSMLNRTQIHELLDLMHCCEYGKGEFIFKVGQKVEAGMYFVREGSVRLEFNKGKDVQLIKSGGYFGEKNMLLDQNKDGHKRHHKRSIMAAISANATTKIDVLYLEECRKVIDTTTLGLGGASSAATSINPNFQIDGMTRHVLLGSGTFGQVWLASIPGAHDGAMDHFALKVQPKYNLIQSDKAERLVAERNILSSLHSPFVLRLYYSCQDDRRLYMVTRLLQGGELESLIPEDGLSESSAKFYAAGILEGLTHMHQKHIIHRDVKSENVLLNKKGYPVLIDFGFAKYVPDKTFTFCGSPMLTAPEIIRCNGYDKGVDHWSWAVTVYRMVTGRYPFYEKGMDELALYKRICKGAFELTGLMSIEFRLLMVAMLYPDPSQRLGSRASGWRDIFASPWFVNDPCFDLSRLRRQTLPAPWIPDIKDALDVSRFHNDSSVDDLMKDVNCPSIPDERQGLFCSFGPRIESPISQSSS